MTEVLKVEFRRDPKSYPIHVGRSLVRDLARFIEDTGKKPVIITDDNVNHHHGEHLEHALGMPLLIRIPPGEASKSRRTKQAIEEMLHDRHYGRDTIIVAFGGGMIGDLAGFVASTFMRGIPFIQVPTSLLAMVDASIGGKTGVNTRHGKNLIGTMWQPKAVFTNVDYLNTLPEDEYLNGLAEIVKIAAIRDEQFFSFIEDNTDKILARDEDILIPLITRSIQLKKEIVEIDYREKGPRQILNFGHTIGHAIEAEGKYSLKHGFCVAIGMIVEARIAGMKGLLKETDEKRLKSLLEKLRIPTTFPDNIVVEDLFSYMKSDKKAKKSRPRFVFIEGIGTVHEKDNNFSFEVADIVVQQALGECRND